MKIAIGTSRIVLIFKTFIIKFPIIRLRKAIKLALRSFAKNQLGHTLRRGNYQMFGTIQFFLFRGIFENWIELIFYKKTHLKLLLPTHYSFFGLFNIMEKGNKVKMDDIDFWAQLYYFTDGKVFVSAHTFHNLNNFCVKDGKLKIADYGARKIHPVLKKYGDKIYNEFNLNFDRKKFYKS